ncbi:hypothetical protein CEQ21_07330 (plasmid) [Niallia circulans]|uniref:Type II secretion system protein GspF domain-containing protein n=1 Tax=Niallia circulans TaxID=1397 RepID=A0A553SQV4_NIACI|nr:hypothetical protein [Niallia circulans]TRZ39365.1 hypothetical protein CEQ21_07330 [Niallia circulans]
MKITKQTTKSKKFYRAIAEKDLYPMLQDMGNSTKSIDEFQKKRLIQSFMVMLIFFFFGLFFTKWLYLGMLAGTLIFYKQKYQNIRSKYTTWRFQRHLQFSKFTRLLIPYLKQSKGQVSLYTVFNKIMQRLEDEQDRNSLYRLMSQMSSKPNDIQPFIEYANRSSGTDMSVLFMSTIFDFQQSTFDTSVIDELGKISSEELINGIDEIIAFKLRRFVFFPTKIVMSSFIIVVGFAIAILISSLSTLNF